jgi:hypothetical protein
MMVAIRPLKYLTGQAQVANGEAGKAKMLRDISHLDGLFAAAASHSRVALGPNSPIVIWSGEELTP